MIKLLPSHLILEILRISGSKIVIPLIAFGYIFFLWQIPAYESFHIPFGFDFEIQWSL